MWNWRWHWNVPLSLKKGGGVSKEPRSVLTSQGFVKLLERDISANSTGLNLLLVQKIYLCSQMLKSSDAKERLSSGCTDPGGLEGDKIETISRRERSKSTLRSPTLLYLPRVFPVWVLKFLCFRNIICPSQIRMTSNTTVLQPWNKPENYNAKAHENKIAPRKTANRINSKNTN